MQGGRAACKEHQERSLLFSFEDILVGGASASGEPGAGKHGVRRSMGYATGRHLSYYCIPSDRGICQFRRNLDPSLRSDDQS